MLIGIDCRKAADFGIGTYIRGLLHGLSRLEGDERYVLFAPAASASLLPTGERFQLVPNESPHYSIEELFNLASEIKRQRVDLFHAPHYVVPFTSRPLVVTIHDLIHIKTRRSNVLESVYANWMIRRATSNGQRILTVSGAVAEEIASRFPQARNKTVVTPNGIDAIYQPRPAPDDLNVVERYGLTAKRYFLYVGNDKPHKNLDRLVGAHEKLLEAGNDLRLAIAGANVSRYGAKPLLSVLGFVPRENLPALYRQALALVLVSLEEGFGLPVAEAMACGTPTIVSGIPALRELTEDAALAVDPHQSESIAQGLARMANDEILRADLAQRGVQRVAKFTWDACAKKTLAVYRSVHESSVR